MGSHAHNDIFSIELNVDGKDIIIDPGSFVYSSNETVRNQFRSVKVIIRYFGNQLNLGN